MWLPQDNLLVAMAARHFTLQQCAVRSSSLPNLCECQRVLPGAQLWRHAAEADHRDLQGAGAQVLGGSTERPGRHEGGAQGRAEPPAEAQRGARDAGHRVLLLVALFVLAD